VNSEIKDTVVCKEHHIKPLNILFGHAEFLIINQVMQYNLPKTELQRTGFFSL